MMTKEEILDAAAQIFRLKGYHATSMQDIAGAVNLQKASLYHHVSSKQEILLELLDQALELLTGEIIEISPILETVSNVNAFRTVVLLDQVSDAKPNALPIGLSATVDVIAGQTFDAVLIPVEALVEISPGEFIVYVVENGQPQPREIGVGLVDFTTAEIIHGLQVGESVTIGYSRSTGN